MGVPFSVCANTLRERRIDRGTLSGVGEDDLVPSSVAELARLLGMGFASIPLRGFGTASAIDREAPPMRRRT